MNAIYWREATWLHGIAAPSSGRKLKYPDTGSEGERGRDSTSIREARALTWDPGRLYSRKAGTALRSAPELTDELSRLTRQRGGQISSSNTAQCGLQRSIPADSPTNRGLTPNTSTISEHMALLTELFTEVNKTFGTKYMYRNAKWKSNSSFFFSYHQLCTMSFSLEWQYPSTNWLLCQKKNKDIKVNNNALNKTSVQYWGLGSSPSITHHSRASQGN